MKRRRTKDLAPAWARSWSWGSGVEQIWSPQGRKKSSPRNGSGQCPATSHQAHTQSTHGNIEPQEARTQWERGGSNHTRFQQEWTKKQKTINTKKGYNNWRQNKIKKIAGWDTHISRGTKKQKEKRRRAELHLSIEKPVNSSLWNLLWNIKAV